MLMITRTESHIEFAIGETRSLSIDVARLAGCMLAAERTSCGRLHQSMLLLVRGSDPIRIEGSPYELAQVHQYVVETMLSESEAMVPPCDTRH